MNPGSTSDSSSVSDHLTQYATTVHGLHQKLDRIRSNQHQVAASLGRAAKALRSMSAASQHATPPAFRNEASCLRENRAQEATCTWGKLLTLP